MGFSYETSYAPTSTITALTFGSTITALEIATGATTNTNSSLSITQSDSTVNNMSGTKGFLGTAGPYYSDTNGATGYMSYVFEVSQSVINFTITRSVDSISINSAGGGLSTTHIRVIGSTDGTFMTSDRILLGGTDLSTTASTSRTFVSRTTSSTDSLGASATFSTTSSGQTTASGTASQFFNGRIFSWTHTTDSSAVTFTQTITTTSSSTYQVPTSTAGFVSTLVSSVTGITSTTTSTSTSSVISYSTTSRSNPVLWDTIYSADTTVWAWKTTTTGGGGVITVVATTVTLSTFKQGAFGRALSTWTPVSVTFTSSQSNGGASVATTSWAETFISPVTQSSTFPGRTTTFSTYETGQPTYDSAMIPLTTKVTVTRNFTTTTQISLTYHTLSTDTFVKTASASATELTFVQTYSDEMTSLNTVGNTFTFTTTFTAGSYPTSNEPEFYSFSATTTTSASNATAQSTISIVRSSGISRTLLARQESSVGGNSTYELNQVRINSSSANPPSFLQPAVTGGFQVWGLESIGGTYGTNISLAGVAAFPIGTFGEIFTRIALPLMDNSTSAFSIGTTAYTSLWVNSLSQVQFTVQTGAATSDTAASTATLQVMNPTTDAPTDDKSSFNTNRTTIGGYGWKRSSTDATTLTASQGIHSYTSYDSTLGSTASTTSWSPTSSTALIEHANALNIETVPRVAVVWSDATNKNPLLTTYSAFPVT